MGNRLLAIGKNQEAQKPIQAAIEFYQQAATASKSGQLQAELNQLSLLVETEQWSEATKLSATIQPLIANLPASRSAVYAQLNFARSLTCLKQDIDTEILSCSSRPFSPHL